MYLWLEPSHCRLREGAKACTHLGAERGCVAGRWAERCHNVPSPLVGEGTMWRAPSHLTRYALRPEMCVSGSAFTGATAESHCFTSSFAGMSGDWRKRHEPQFIHASGRPSYRSSLKAL